MEYDTLLSIILYIGGCFYLFFGISGITSNFKSRTNRLFLYLTLLMSFWSLTLSIAISAPTEESSIFWMSMTVFGRGIFFSLLLHFIILLTKTTTRFKYKRLLISLIYLPPVVNIILFGPFGFFKNEIYQMIPSKFGWIHIMPMGWMNIWLSLFYLTFTLIAVTLVIRWWFKLERGTVLKRHATLFLISVLSLLCFGFGLDILPDFIGTALIPKVSIIFLIFPILLLFVSLKTSGILLEKDKTVIRYPRSQHDRNRDRLRLFHTTSVLFMVGALASFMIGYFGMKKPIKQELITAAFIFVTSIFLLFLPLITKKYFIQNIIFLLICIGGMVFFMMSQSNKGALTVWSLYIIFLLLTVVLENKHLAIIFTLVCIVLQIILIIFYPKVIVTLDINEYVLRIFIIFLSYLAVRFLTKEYTLKMRGYQRFANEQEALEKLSTKFISVTGENAQTETNEMLRISAEVLDFDYGYLMEFSKDYEDATVINVYSRDDEIIYTEGTKLKTETFPIAKSLINSKQSIGCPDTTSISIHDDAEEREFFASRGILSYYAQPIVIEDKVLAVLIIENRKKVNLNIWENQRNFLGVIVNILADTKKKNLYEEKLYEFAYYDETTKLPNKNMLMKTLEQNLQDRIESEKLAVLYVELENLRMINDTFGHRIGDKIVIKSASIIKNMLGECCYISRVEHSAFMIVLPKMKTIEQIQNFINEITDAFSVPILPSKGKETLFVTTAIGVAIYPDDGNDAETLVQNADLAGYEAKHTDDKVVFCSDQLTTQITENTLLTNRLFTAMENEEFSLEFQPLIQSKTGKTAGVEALLRWNYDVDKRIRPDIFIPILEKTGLIHEVGLWVLEQTLKEHNRLVANGFQPLRFSVNISIVQFRKDDFVPEVIKLITESKVDPKYIELEITESFLSTNFADTIKKLSQLKEFGVSIAIDDFGKGYSSFHRLELVPFDRIKIDKSIVDDIIKVKKKTVIVQTIVSLAKALMADTTAEGVETKEQLDFLVDMDCDEIQGYYYSRPLPIEALEEFLKKEK